MLLALLAELAAVVVAMLQSSLILQRSSTIWNSYCSQLRKRPILTKAATGVVGTVIGDGIAQFTTRKTRSSNQPAYDVPRVSRLCAYAALIGTPIGHYWFNFLDKGIFPNAMGHPVTALVKTFLDQAIMAPAGIGLFFTCLGIMEGKSASKAVSEMKEKFKPTLMANYVLWPAANLINFAFVPPSQRILYCNVIYIFWVSFLSSMANKTQPKQGLALDPALAQKEL